MSKINSFWKLLKKRKWYLISALVVLALAGFLLNRDGGPIETVLVKNDDLVRTVKISGKVTPNERVDLAFEVAGTVASVGKPVGSRVYSGETLLRLNTGTISADINKAEAELASAQAELNKLEGTQVYENSITNAKRSIVQAIRDAYTAASDAVQNKADQVFVDPLSSRPEIAGSFDSYNDLKNSVNTTRVEIGYMLPKWNELVNSLGSSAYTEAQLKLSKEYLTKTVNFITEVSQAVNMFKVTSYMTQSDIESYRAALLSARDSLNQASQGFITAENTLSKTLSDVPVQLARVEAAKATVQNLRFQLAKASLTSPISGVVAKQDGKLGQAVTAGTQLVSVISPDYVIETFVPEVSIAGIKIGNTAAVTLDAYGPKEIFQAKVTHIDPAETIKDGVSTYKVKLTFISPDERVRSGMTANVEIETFRKASVLMIPERALVREGEETFVYKLSENNEKVKVLVNIGERDSKGNVEILSEVVEGTPLVLNPK
jgi:HlyD family secretion protein